VASGEQVTAGLTALALQQANGIADPTKLRPGMVLKVPVVAAAAPPAAPASPAPISPAPVATSPIASPKPASPEPKRVAALGTVPTTSPVISDASPAPAPASAAPTVSTATPKFRWPVKGRVVAAFGPRPDSTHNDGINIAVPAGAEVVAAEGGMVAYAGNELKGYGNLVLIRHENNWVTAYAHNDEILVKRGDKVKRGQPIARAGRTGADGQPHVHFEVRQGSRPVDPIPYLEGN
ncbi:MAG TPA: M23 family metallopeptidase, partial [Hyphomicrobiaceae bacterium]|nr:M23 family metallopeptidase [Hyphomicrobiaceae bacterium]